MASHGYMEINFNGILTWDELKKRVNVAGRGIPGTAKVLLSNNGSAFPNLREQKIVIEWDFDEATEESLDQQR